jgi:hypothetical protein
MPTEIEPPKPPVSFYGKKTYLLHMLIVEKIIQRKNIQANFYEDVDKDRDR